MNPGGHAPLTPEEIAAAVSLHSGIREAMVLGRSDVTITLDAAVAIRDEITRHRNEPAERAALGEREP